MKCRRLSWDLLVRAMDKELSPEEEQVVRIHLAACEACRRECAAIDSVSLRIHSVVDSASVAEQSGDRQQLAARMESQDLLKPLRHAPENVMRRFGWGMAIAAALALGIVLAPKQKTLVKQGSPAPQAAVSSAIEVDGETFIALPYSNPDLPEDAPRIVQMQVPVSSLADIGIALEPVANQVLNQDRSVLADVLLGADGQPLGVHVVSWE
jgi:anti-sigma factor RsiW